MEKHYDLMIARPAYGDLPAKAEVEFLQMWQYTEAAGYKVVYRYRHETLIEEARNALAAERSCADWILWLDVDMSVPQDLAVRLMAHNQPIVGTLAFAKGVPARPCSYVLDEREMWQPLYDWPDNGLIEVDATGFGCILTASWVFDHMPPKPFIRNIRQKNGDYMGEDYAFCYRAQMAGFAILVDTSLDVGHYGTYRYSAKDFKPHRDEIGIGSDGRKYYPKLVVGYK